MTLTNEWYYNDNVTRLGVNKPLIQLARSLLSSGVPIVISTARPGRLRGGTQVWLKGVGLSYDALYMREDGDDRPDYLVKGEQALSIIEDFGSPLLWYDDKPSNCRMVRSLGIPCIQVIQ